MVRQSRHKLKIYTKTGDNGKTSLFGGKRVSKANSRVEVYGEIDELNSLIGIVINQSQKSKVPPAKDWHWRAGKSQNYNSKFKSELINIQKDLLEIGSVLGNPAKRLVKKLPERVKHFENLIDEMDEKLPKLNNFILPGGSETGSLLHFSRAVCRRAERRIVQLSKKEKVNPQIIAYFNRLSDTLFVMARLINLKEKQKEMIWVRKE